MQPPPIFETSMFRRVVLLLFFVVPLSVSVVRATILTFEDFPSSNIHLNAVANPFGAGQYGSRATSAINTGFQQGDGWTTNVVLNWGIGWQTYTGWPFGNDAQTGAGRVVQADFSEAGATPLLLTFTPDAGFGVQLKSFAFTVWDNSPVLPVQIRWTVYGGSVAPGNVLATGESTAFGASGGAQTINTGLSSVHAAASPVILRWELLSGDPTWVAINNVNFNQGPARVLPVITWATPDAILVGTELSATQLNATANVAGSFTYNPTNGAALSAGLHTLTAQFTPADTNTYAPVAANVSMLVKSNNTPVITVRGPGKIGTNDLLSATMFQTTADVRGSFSFSPAPGTLLPLGTNIVTVTFTPSNSVFTTMSTNVILIGVPFVPEGTIWTFTEPTDRLLPLFGDDVLTYHNPNTNNWPATKIAFGAASSFGLPLPTGGDREVMRFSHTLATEGFRLSFNDGPNGVYIQNGWLANYTLVFDVLYPANGFTRPLFNSNPGNTGSAEAFINASSPTGAVQVSSLSYGEIRANTWHRITIVVRSASAEGQAHVYVDGTFVGAIGSNDSIISAAYALEQFLFLLTSGNGNAGVGYLSGLRFVGRNLDYEEVNALGGVHAEGPHIAGAPAPRPPFQPFRDVVIIGHRGNGGFAPEDTMPSFLSSFAAGGDVVEADVRLTSDNRVVVMHDSTVDRTTDGSGSVAAMTLAQLQTLDAGSWFSPRFAGTRPPALRELMAAVKDAYPEGILYLDLKVNGMATQVKADADATGFPYERLWFWVYDQTGEAAAYRGIFPNGKIFWGEGNWANGASIGSWPSLTTAQKDAVVAGMKGRGVWGFDFGDNEATSLNPTTLQELRAAGFFVSCYSALHPRSMTSAINYLGVDGMETDFPPVLRNLMPIYRATSTATPLSDAAAQVTWSRFANTPPIAEVRVRAKRKAAPPSTWTNAVVGLPSIALTAFPTGLRTNTLYEFQPIGYDAAGNPVAFGSVSETNTLAPGNNFTNAYAAWQTNYPGVGAPAANPDDDFYPNLVEFALGLNPFDAAVPLEARPTTTIQNGTLILQYRRRAGSFVRHSYESSTDLQAWTPLFEFVNYTAQVQPAPAGMEIVTVRAVVPPGAPHWFLRTRVQAIP
jgi:glycerophosphoryl diester phosphodiesterase